ncbi:MAG: sigma-70 family RNA polymerase sigma factor [Deltaproteobacteria bacterium]|nr:sigma-70 family RNA polymerase sigma factor [Deltaproteobacteria bacterium]
MLVDEGVIAELYQRYGPPLYRRCLHLVCNEQDARELLQEVFYQFWRDRGRFEGRSSAFTYLYRIATNLSIDRLRRRRTAGEQVSNEQVALTGHHNPAQSAAPVDELAELTRGLDEETLTVAVMAYVDGLTQEEIAVALQLSRRTIGKRLKRFLAHTRGRAKIAVMADAGAGKVAPARGAHGR